MTDALTKRLRTEGDGVMSRREKSQIADMIEQLEAERRELRAHIERLRDALINISEYWNQARNDSAMFDALVHIEEVAISAIAATPAQSLDALLDPYKDHIERLESAIALYDQALKASWLEGENGDAFNYWNAARKIIAKGEKR